MALGFGFNKAKVLASAEKYVQQGKLQNAIQEYEKVVKEDHKDLTVLNTIGDLYSRIGQNENAVKYFQKVGEAYAHDGFTVKAIAMYKKLTKIAPPHSVEYIQRLAELYTIQGLYNDARAQYVQVADGYLKSGNNEEGAKVFQKILELDPDNTAMQQKLADLYIKLGKKTEARNIFFTAAQSLFSKGSMDAADEALGRVLSLDPKNVDALLLRGSIAAEAGDGASAQRYLSEIPDIDSRPEGLRALLKAHLQQKELDAAGPIAQKLITVHNDLGGVHLYADGLLNAGKFPEALKVYEQHADAILAASGGTLPKTITGAIAKVKESAPALESLRGLFQKSGDNSHDAEIRELLAHAYVQDNQLDKAKELYKELAENEPENPLHAQNYKQVLAKLGEDTTAKMSADQGSQAIMMEEFEQKSLQIQPDYTPDVAAAVQQALTDSELFDSYNLPAKAIAPLEKGLHKAPRDHQLHQRLAPLYVKSGRYTDAARSCNILKEVYETHGMPEEGAKFAKMAADYLAQAPAGEEATPMQVMEEPAAGEAAVPAEAPAAPAEAFSASSVSAFAMETEAPPPPAEIAMEVTPSAPAAGAAHEVNVDDWESMLSVEEKPAAAAPPPPEITMEVTPPAAEAPAQGVTEYSFEVTPEAPPAAPPAEISMEVTPVDAAPADAGSVQEISFAVEEPQAAPPPPPPPPPPVAKPAPPAPVVKPAPPPPPAPVAKPAPPPPPKPAPVAASAGDELDLLGDLASDLESSLGEGFEFGGGKEAAKAPPAKAAPPPPPPPAPPAPVAPESVPAGFSSMGHELEEAKPEIEHHEASSALSDIFAEFKEDSEATAGQAEDPETHYNLGIAFKEMGLLDEAIGELQKVCQAVDHGHAFPQVIQAYTWLAQCLVDKGVPQAAIRWYEKALTAKGMDDESRLSVFYDLGNAYEMSGNAAKAKEAFLNVYGANIDYRDVADRLKALK